MAGSENFGMSSTLMEVFGVAKGAGALIFHVIDNVPTINPLLNRGITPTSAQGNIELKNVIFHYPSRPDVAVSAVIRDLIYHILFSCNIHTIKIKFKSNMPEIYSCIMLCSQSFK